MDWLKDKKNQPIVAAIAAVVVVGAVVVLWMTVFSGGSSQEATATDAGGMETPVDQSAESGGPAVGPDTGGGMSGPPAGQPQQPAGQPAGAQVASVKPMETYRADPFLPVGYKPIKRTKLTPPIPDLPILNLGPWPKPIPPEQEREPDQPVRRLSGVMLNGRVYAIIETSGSPRPQIVQPGEPLEDGLAIVERIEADKVILKTTSRVPRYLTVRLASAARRPSSEPNVSVSPSSVPSGPPMPSGPPGGTRRSRYGPRGG